MSSDSDRGRNENDEKFTYTITDPLGLHARPAGNLAKLVKTLDSAVTLAKAGGEKPAAGSKLMSIMSLGSKTGETITVTVEGGHEEENAAVMERFFKENL